MNLLLFITVLVISLTIVRIESVCFGALATGHIRAQEDE